MIIIRNAEAQGLCLERKKWGAAFGGAAPLWFVGSAWSTVVDYLTTILRAALLPLFMMSLTIYTPASVGR